MSRPRRIRLVAIAVLALATFVASVLALVALGNGGEALGLKVAAGYDRRAETLLVPPSVNKAEARREAVRLSRAAISQYPYDTSAWLRIAYVDSLDHGGLTPAGVAALKRSYDLVAVDPFVGVWRIRFALENSEALTPELRAEVRGETEALFRNGEYAVPLRQVAQTLHNPAGRLSLALWLNRLEAVVAK